VQWAGQNQRDAKEKTIKWRASQVKSYYPNSPATTFSKMQMANTFPTPNPLQFHPSQLPLPSPQLGTFAHPFNSPLFNSHNVERPQLLPPPQGQTYNHPYPLTQHDINAKMNPFASQQGINHTLNRKKKKKKSRRTFQRRINRNKKLK
jgi:hypothetical protein